MSKAFRLCYCITNFVFEILHWVKLYFVRDSLTEVKIGKIKLPGGFFFSKSTLQILESILHDPLLPA